MYQILGVGFCVKGGIEKVKGISFTQKCIRFWGRFLCEGVGKFREITFTSSVLNFVTYFSF